MLKKFLSGLIAVALAALTAGLGATSASALPVTTSWTDAGLQEMFSVNGNITWSADGLGINSGQTGNIQVNRPAASSVIAAFLLVSTNAVATAPTDVKVNNAAVTFTHKAAETTSGYGFTNYLADVTTNVKAFLDVSGPGVFNIPIDNGVSQTADPNADPYITGDALVVVFNTPGAPLASIVLNFGTSAVAGDTFALAYPSLTLPQTADLQMSIGDAFSYGADQNSVITVNGQTLTENAGHFDDNSTFVAGQPEPWAAEDPALITVGGVGDSLTNPTLLAPWSTTADDELYSLSPFVAVGDTTITVNTNNASNDDNLFMALFYLKEITVTGSAPASSLGTITTPLADPVLADTGFDASIPLLGALVALLGGVVIARRRINA
jgi:hypothetical protein